MEPVTHFLTGACLGRAGLNRRTALATFTAFLAAEAPDIDVLWHFAGPVPSFAHHRGITHTLIAAPVMALVSVAAAVWLHRLYSGIPFIKRRRERLAHPPQPIHWPWLYLTALIATLSHLLLDFTNNYGLRPFFPFNPRWYSLDLVFIAEPLLWAVFLAAIFFPWLLSLADSEVGVRAPRFRGRIWAIFALSFMAALWCWRWAEHAHARTLVETGSLTTENIRRVALMPYPVNPFRWHAILQTDSGWLTAEVNSRTDELVSDPKLDYLAYPASTPASLAARRTALAQVYLDWSSWPVVRDLGPRHAPGFSPLDLPPSQSWTNVEFCDLRFAYRSVHNAFSMAPPEESLAHQISTAPLCGYVYIANSNQEAAQFLNGREQK